MYELNSIATGLEFYDELIVAIEAIEEITDIELEETAAEFQDEVEALGELGSNRFGDGFATEKSRRWYFAQVNAGKIPTDGKRYIRQGSRPYGWTIQADIENDSKVIVVFNSWDEAIYVFGNRQGRRQVPGHRRSGHPLAGAQLPSLQGRINVRLVERLQDRLYSKQGLLGRLFRR